MFWEENVRIVSLDSEGRVKGICQLMDGVIFDLFFASINSKGDAASIIYIFSNAMDSLDYYLSLASRFLEKHRQLKQIDGSEVKRYHSLVKQKHGQVTRILKKEYVALGLPHFEKYCRKKVPYREEKLRVRNNEDIY
jgi:hypothetical protein